MNTIQKIIIPLCLVISAVFLNGCSDTEKNEPQQNEYAAQQSKQECTLPFEQPAEFNFSSGAGAWGTLITLNSDGSFEGLYHDSEMGEVGEAYPDGTVYLSEFHGCFDEIKQINDYSYSMVLKKLEIQDEEKEWIENKIRYVISQPSGLETEDEFIFYLPQTPLEELSEEFLSWGQGKVSQSENKTLSSYGIYNKTQQSGFFSYE